MAHMPGGVELMMSSDKEKPLIVGFCTTVGGFSIYAWE